MESTQNSASPLSPYLWGAPHQIVVPPGSKVGKVADIRRAVADFELNFDLIVKQRADPFPHPVYDAYYNHPLHTKALNKRQFDVLRYGMVLDEAERLVLVQAPHGLADSGAVVAREFQAIFNDRLDNTETAQHTLLPEYCFLVLQLPETAEKAEAGDSDEEVPEVMPKILFRLVFRNEAYNEEAVSFMCQQFPLFRLRAVFVSSKVYPQLQELFRYRQNHPGVYMAATGKILPDPKVEDILDNGDLKELCDVWLKVLDGIAPDYVKEKGLGPDVVGLFLRTHRAQNGCAVQDRSEDYSTPQVDNLVRLSYLHNKSRMEKRIDIVARERGLLYRWRDGEFDMEYFAEELDDAEPGVKKAAAARIILKLTRDGNTDLVDGEICAYVPKDHEYKDQKVYRTAAAERLRLWVLKGLMSAEIHGVHVVLVDIDTALLLFHCVGLLWGEGEENRQGEYVFHVCKIVVETVEDYIQHSGVIWKAIIVLSDEDNLKAASLCNEILEVARSAKHRVEMKERQKVDNAEQEEAEREYRRQLVEDHARQRAAEKAAEEQVLAAQANSNGQAMVPYDEQRAQLALKTKSSMPNSIIETAERCGVHVDDAVLYPVFESLCDRDTPVAPVSKVVALLLSKLKGNDQKSEYWPHEHPLLSLDSCGIPCDEKSVFNFVMGFCLKTYNGSSKEGVQSNDEFYLNYIEFSMMMLALAKQ